MAIIEMIYNKNKVVRTRRCYPPETIPIGFYRNRNLRRLHIIDDDTISIQEVELDRLPVNTREHAHLSGAEINATGGITGIKWGNFRREYIWTPSEITPQE